LCRFSHPNIVQFIGVTEKNDDIYIVTEYVAGGNLRQFLKDKKVDLPWELRIQIAIDIASGMAFLHSKNVIHRDLKSKNILVEDNWRVKVCDFGFARSVNTNRRQLMTVCGTNDWMAPEVMLGHPYDYKADIFSFGMILVEILTRAKVGEDLRRVADTNYRLDEDLFQSLVPTDCPSGFVEVALQCCQYDAHIRPSFKDITKILKTLVLPLNKQGLTIRPPPPIVTGNTRGSGPPTSQLSSIKREEELSPKLSNSASTDSPKRNRAGMFRAALPHFNPNINSPLDKPVVWANSWDTAISPSPFPSLVQRPAMYNVVSANPLYQPKPFADMNTLTDFQFRRKVEFDLK